VLTVMIFIAMPHLDVIIEDWAERGLAVPAIPIVATAARQTTRFGLLIVTASLLGVIWAAPLAVGSGFELGGIVREAFEIAVIALVAAFLWNIVATMTVRASRYERLRLSGTPWATGLPRSRLGTIVPLMSAGGKTGIVAVALVAVLIILGFNVWPLITGLSVFGLAVGFGCQALVKDVVTGPFLLIDDSFRFGEHIETAGARGTVEKISIRSVSLRSDGGSIVTVPYGQIGNIENFSRDWATETLSFRVPFETDIHLLLSLLDEIGNGMAVDPELASGFLRPFRSTGISDVENSCLTITAEFTARPGRQAAIRRAALKAAQLGFKERGIRLVS
jgi:small-conductance mechanosensitive channel